MALYWLELRLDICIACVISAFYCKLFGFWVIIIIVLFCKYLVANSEWH
jgi:hypothetical protein